MILSVLIALFIFPFALWAIALLCAWTFRDGFLPTMRRIGILLGVAWLAAVVLHG